MSNKISRRSFLKSAGVGVAAVALAGCTGVDFSWEDNGKPIEVRINNKISNWKNLAVQLSGIYEMAEATDVEGYEYVAVLVMAANQSKTDTFNIGAQNIVELGETYPLTGVDDATKAANVISYFHALSAATTDFSVACDDQAVEAGAYVSLYNSETESLSDSPCLPPQGVGYIDLMCMVPIGWQTLTITFTPTFVDDGKSMVFSLTSEDLTAADSSES